MYPSLGYGLSRMNAGFVDDTAIWHGPCYILTMKEEKTMRTRSIVAVEVSMALAGIAMMGLMLVVSFL
jgi:hypothetical protein